MSKIFSNIALGTNTGIRDAGIMSDISEVEDIQRFKVPKDSPA